MFIVRFLNRLFQMARNPFLVRRELATWIKMRKAKLGQMVYWTGF